MANEITKLNAIAIGDIAKFNGLTDSDIEKFNALEWSSGPADVWSSADAMNDSMSGAGGHCIGQVNTAVIVAGGYEGAFTDDTQERDGTTWATVSPVLSATRQEMGAAGSSTAGAVFGGWPGAGGNTDVVELWSCSAWGAADNNLGVADKGANRGVGIANNAILEATGNVDGSGTAAGKTASTFDGTSWTTRTAPPTAAQYVSSFGEQSVGYFCGGSGYPNAMNAVMKYTLSGDSFATDSATLRINQFQQGFSFGSSTAAIIGGGAGATTGTSYGANKDHADTWNGTAFSAAATVPYGLNDMHGAGSQAAGTAFGGGGGSHVDTCVTYA